MPIPRLTDPCGVGNAAGDAVGGVSGAGVAEGVGGGDLAGD